MPRGGYGCTPELMQPSSVSGGKEGNGDLVKRVAAVHSWVTTNLRLLESKRGKGKHAEEFAPFFTLTSEPGAVDLGGTDYRRLAAVEVDSSVRTNRDCYVQLFATVKSPTHYTNWFKWHETSLTAKGAVCLASPLVVLKSWCTRSLPHRLTQA